MPTCRECERDLPETRFDLQWRRHGARRRTCRSCRGARQPRARAPAAPRLASFDRPLKAKRYLITSAQNQTAVHAGFFAALERAAEALKAEIIVIPYRYKNPTAWDATQAERAETWDPKLSPYLLNARKKLCKHLILAADVRVQATTANPLGGFEALTGSESCIIGHPKMQFRSVPVPQTRYAKILTTTGACTVQNLSTTKAGALAKFHHYLGALLVEIDGSHFYLRQLNADRSDGSFIDLNLLYTASGVRKAPRAKALVMGDAHIRFIDRSLDRARFGKAGVVECVDPESVIWHDTHDGYAINPHHAGNPFIAQAKQQAQFGDVRAEVEEAVRFVVERTKGRRSIIVPSNHDRFLARWITTTDWRQNPANARFYLETALAMLDSARMGPGGAVYEDPFRYWVERLKGSADLLALREDESCMIAGIEVGQHGDRGPNGARGTLKNLARVGAQMITGHEHSPGIEEGHYRVGTSTPRRLEYTHGPGGWQNTDCVIYANGARALITYVDGKWRL